MGTGYNKESRLDWHRMVVAAPTRSWRPSCWLMWPKMLESRVAL